MSGATQQQTPVEGGETLDTFANTAPIDSPVDQNSQGGGMDTFDNMQVHEPQQDVVDEKQAEAAETEEKLDDTPLKTLSDSEGKVEESEEGAKKDEPESKPEEEIAAKDSEDTDGNEETPSEEKPKGPTIRVKEGDKAVDLSPEATVPVKVDGKKKFVPLNELREAYSSKEVREKEYGELKAEKQTFKKEHESFTQSRDVIANHMKHIGGLIDKGLKGEENPLAAMRYLVEKSGVNVVDFDKQVMEYLSEEVDAYNTMDDVERRLYWKERENEYLKNNQATLQKQREQIKAQEERSIQTLQTREKYGVSGEQYEKAKAELSELGYNLDDASPENICKYVALQPFAEKAEGLCDQFNEDLGDEEMDELVREVTNTLYENKNISDKQAIKFAAAKLGYEVEDVEEQIEQINDKVIPRKDPEPKGSKVAARDDNNHVETFDDFNQYEYGR